MLLIFNFLTQIPNFYFFSNKFNEIELGTIYNSLCHASLVSSLSIYYLLKPEDHIYQIISSYSQVYLMIDLLAINYFSELKKYQKIYTIHHILFLLSYYLVDKDIYKYIICKLLLVEISVIFMDLRIISKFYNCGYLNELSYITYITFFIFRIVNMPILVYEYYIPLSNIYANYIFIPMYSLQLYWFYNMTLKVLGHNNKNE